VPIDVEVVQSLDLIVWWDVMQNCRCTTVPGRILAYFPEVRFNARDARSLQVSIE
jgi:hypothetical protein